jgi:hypothetical protein
VKSRLGVAVLPADALAMIDAGTLTVGILGRLSAVLRALQVPSL